jgi:asparagine synthase (glutamine-hydrolysing)
MGAIAVYLGDAEEPLALVGAMLESAPHRGSRTAFVTLGNCSLGAIWNEDAPDAEIGTNGHLAVAFVGTIDNREELTEALSTPGSHDPPADSNAGLVELIARAYREYGTDVPARLRGLFAGIVSDGSTVYCFRDHLGYRPLFYRHDGRRFWAASEPKQVVAGAGIPLEPDLTVIEALFYRNLDDRSPSALRGVERLPKMTGLLVDAGGARRRRYWFPERLLETASFRDSELQDRFDHLMTTAVRRSLRGDDVIFLSGGIDSPAITAYAAPLHRQLFGSPLTAVSVIYPKYPAVDESRYVRLLADHYDIPLHVVEQEANATDDFRRWTAIADTPYRAAALAQYEESYLQARALGSSNVLTGELAEFLMAIQWYTLDHYLSHGRFRSAWRQLLAYRANGRSWLHVLRRAGRAAAPGDLIKAVNRLKGRRSPLVPMWVDIHLATDEKPVPVRDRWRRSQLGAFVGPGTSLEADEICQAVCGVTVRRPWTDVDLWEFFLSLPAEQKFPDLRSKSLVRTLLRNRVPDEILDRTDKTVFDDAARDRMDYNLLTELLIGAGYQVPGVDYRALARLITERTLTMLDYQWARDLANIHAFLDRWTRDTTIQPSAPTHWLPRQPEGVTSR